MQRRTIALMAVSAVVAASICTGLIIAIIQDEPLKNLTDNGINWDTLRSAKHFRDLFQPIEEIKLTGSLISDIKQFIILPDEKMIVREGKAVKLFGSDGTFKRAIGAIGQGPGEYMKPNYVAIDDSLKIYILDSKSRRVTVFDSLGQEQMQLSFNRMGEEIVISGHRIYFHSAINFYRDHMGFCLEYPSGKLSFDFAEPTKYLMSFKSNMIPPPLGFGEYLKSYGRKIYISHPYEYLIREISLDGKELRQIKGKSPLFSPTDPTKGFNPSIPPAEAMGSIIKSMVIWKDLIFVFYFGKLDSKELYLDVFTLLGEQVNRSTIVSKEPNASFGGFFITVASNGYFYSYYQPESENPAEIPNPVLVKYRFTPLSSSSNI